jgi:hypothetical protein
MKLYTEKDLNKAMLEYIQGKTRYEIINSIKPIELPSDEEIEKYINSFPYTKHLDDGQYNDGVIVGAELGIEWYREQLKQRQ